jgi:hypothetical protein
MTVFKRAGQQAFDKTYLQGLFAVQTVKLSDGRRHAIIQTHLKYRNFERKYSISLRSNNQHLDEWVDLCARRATAK